MWQVLVNVAAIIQLFVNAPQLTPAYKMLSPRCQEYVVANVWQFRWVDDNSDDDTMNPRYRHALASMSARTGYWDGAFWQGYLDTEDGLRWMGFVMVHEAAHAEDWRLYGYYVKTEAGADTVAWSCYLESKYGWPLGVPPQAER